MKIDVAEYQKKLMDRFLIEGFVKLDEPVDTDEVWYVAISPDGSNFDQYFWEPTVQSLLRSVRIKEFYRVDVYYDYDILCITASRGDNPLPRVNTP